MHRATVSAILLFFLMSYFCQAESFWKIKTESGEEILLRIDVDSQTKTFVASTRKDAIKDIAGFFTYNLAHAAGKLKYPEIVYIEGKTNPEKDSLKLDGVFYYTDKKYDFQASISGNNFLGKYTDTRKRVHRLVGFKQADGRPVNNYPAILSQAVAYSEKYLPDPEWIKTGDWKDFKAAVNELKTKVSDDYELGAFVIWYSRKFSFSPFDISKIKPGEQKPKPNIQIIRPHIGLFNGSQLPQTAKQKDSLAAIISKQSISKLILDLRGRLNITPVQAKLMLDYLSPKDFYAGVWLGRRWYNLHPSFSISDAKSGSLKTLSGSEQTVIFRDTDGYVLDIKSDNQSYPGEVFVLIDSKTSKVAEVLAGLLQRERLAKIFGQKSAAQPWITEKIKIGPDYELQIPVAVFLGRDNRNLLKTGVTPDVVSEKENALNYLLKKL